MCAWSFEILLHVWNPEVSQNLETLEEVLLCCWPLIYTCMFCTWYHQRIPQIQFPHRTITSMQVLWYQLNAVYTNLQRTPLYSRQQHKGNGVSLNSVDWNGRMEWSCRSPRPRIYSYLNILRISHAACMHVQAITSYIYHIVLYFKVFRKIMLIYALKTAWPCMHTWPCIYRVEILLKCTLSQEIVIGRGWFHFTQIYDISFVLATYINTSDG